METEVVRRIRELLTKTRMTQADLARYGKWDKSTVSMWLSGKRRPSTRHCLKLMMLLYERTGEEVSYVYYKKDERGNL